MKKWLLCSAVGLILALTTYFSMRTWIYSQCLKAIEIATGSKAEAQAMNIELFANRVSLHGLTLTASNPSGYWERMTASEASSQIHWDQWNSGIIPMEVSLDGCQVTLRERSILSRLQDQLHNATPATPVTPSPSVLGAETRHSKLLLSEFTATNVTIQDGPATIAEGLNCKARRGFAGWQGELTADRAGSLPLTEVRVSFSTETPSTRLTEFRCKIKEGSVSGAGTFSEETGAALDLQVDSLQLSSVTPQWCPISGMLSSKFTYKGDPFLWQQGTVSGDFSLKEASLQLGAAAQLLTLLGSTTSNAALQHASVTGSLKLTGERWEISNLALEQSDLFSIKGSLACTQGANLKANLNLGLSKALSGETTSPEATPDDRFTWTALSIETTPEQLWNGILGSLLKSGAAGVAAHTAPAKTNLQEKAKNAVGTLLNLLTH